VERRRPAVDKLAPMHAKEVVARVADVAPLRRGQRVLEQ
jgi:hypothetical protein